MRQPVARFFSLPPKGFPGHIRPIATKLNLGLPTAARSIEGQNLEDFPVTIKISRKHLIDEPHVKYLTGPEQPLTAKYLSFYTDRTPQPLVIRAYAYARSDSAKVVVINRARIRLRRAFCVALAKNGYNWLGAGISKQLGTKEQQIWGTVVLAGEHPQKIMLLEFPKLVDYFSERIRDVIAPRLKRGAKQESSKLLPADSELEPGILDENRE